MKNRKKSSNPSRWIFILVLIFFSCRKNEDLPSFPANSDDAVSNFDACWQGIDDNYTFFAYQNLNWDEVYNEFRPKVTSGMSQNEFKSVIFQMMNTLIDGHRLIYYPIDTTVIYNAFSGTNYGEKYSYVNYEDVIENNYLRKLAVFNFVNDQDKKYYKELALSEILGKNIWYLKCYTFESTLDYDSNNSIFDDYLNQFHDDNVNGLILDLRGNGGGTATAFKNLISKFVSGNYTWGYSKFRLGRDRYEMTPYIAETASFSGTQPFTKPLVILTDRYSFSAAELTALALHNLPNVTLIGDTTGGAEGPIISVESDEPLSKDFTGNFRMPNGWLVQLAEKATFDNQKQIFEGKGLPPDIVEKPSQSAADAGKDNVLDRAILFLEK